MMRRSRIRRLLGPLLLATALLATGCSSGGEDVVTVTQRAGEPSSPPAPDTTPAPPTDPGSSDPDSSEPGTTSEPVTAEPVTTSEPESPTPPSSTSRRSSTAATTRPTAPPTANDPDADPDVAGPTEGVPCSMDASYVDEQPTGLRADVLAGWRAIEKAANAEGIYPCLNDGKRSRAQQQAQYDEYVEEYGKDVADQLVLKPENSAHVKGYAIDVQPAAANQWLQRTKGSLGFCRIYDNEPWHFEYDVAYFTQGCPARLPKPTN